MPPAKRIILVVQGAKERDLMAKNLGQAGYLLTIVDDGALAINKAVADPPDMIITSAEMPMVDGFKLCQLLRSNPATRHVPFIFVTDKETNPKKLSQFIRPDDDFILRPFKMEELLGRVHNLFYRLDKVMEVTRDVDRSVAGTLTEIALVDLLQIFKMNRKNGILSLRADGQTGVIHIREGKVVNSQIGRVSGEKAIFRLITWQRGTFEFKPVVGEMDTKIHMPTESLVMEGLRQLDELNRLREKLPSKGMSLKLKKTYTGPVAKLKPVTREVLSLLQCFSRVEEVLDNCTYPDLDVYATIQSLLEHDIIEVAGEAEQGAPAGPAPLLSLEESLKIGYFLGVGRGEQNQKWLGKVIIFAQSPEQLEVLLERGRHLPEFHLEEKLTEADEKEKCIAGVKAAVNLMDTMTLLLFHVSPSAGNEPLWRALHHRTVGALLIGDGGREGEAVMGPVSAYLADAKIPFAAVSITAREGSVAPEGKEEAGIPWRHFDPSLPDFTRRALRALFEAILTT